MSEKRIRDYLKDIREVHPKTILMVKGLGGSKIKK